MDIDWIDETGIVRLGDDVNAFDSRFVAELHAALDVVEARQDARALVTVGGGKHYSNGFDIEFLGSLDGARLTAFMDDALRVLTRLLTFPVPTAAAMNGHAFGIGAMLALAHDRRIARDDRGWFCLPEVDLGMPFHPLMLALIRHRMAAPVVEEAVLSGRRYDGADAVAAGIAHATAPVAELIDAAIAATRPLAGKGRDVVVALKRALHAPVLAHIDG